jgi:hypothetical protein
MDLWKRLCIGILKLCPLREEWKGRSSVVDITERFGDGGVRGSVKYGAWCVRGAHVVVLRRRFLLSRNVDGIVYVARMFDGFICELLTAVS